MTEYTVAVKALAEFCHRSGDIDHRFTPSPTGAQGTEGHQRSYRRRPPSYQPEYPVALDVELETGSLKLRGRADGYDPQRCLVEEIKTCRVDPARIPDSVTRLHLAQGRLYAALIARQENLAEVTVQLTWLQLDEDCEYPLEQRYSRAELDRFLEQSLATYSAWLALIAEGLRARDLSLSKMVFPFADFRAGQREIAELVYKCIDQSGQLLLEAPTGIGKTAAVLFPALKGLATGKHDRIIFTTAREVGRRTAEDTLQHFRDSGWRGSSLSLTARDKVCLSPGKACHGEDCPFARGYYDKLPAAREAAVAAGQLTRGVIESLARDHEVCPYQLALDMVDWVDVVIADLHYLYSLTAALGERVASDAQRWTVLVDEAHNLPGRARDMYRASITKSDLMLARATAAPSVKSSLDRINRLLLGLQKEQWADQDYDCVDTVPERLQAALQDFVSAAGEALAADPLLLQRNPEVLDFYFSVLQFLRVLDQWGEEFRFEKTRGKGKQSLRLTLNCLDPARLLARRQEQLHASVAFSATLSPTHWLRPGLGYTESAVCRQLDSPFAPEQLAVKLECSIDTRYRQRTATLPPLAARISRWLKDQPGNCIVYFPSYRYLQDCLALLGSEELEAAGRTIWIQGAGSDPAERESLLPMLLSRRDVAAFCILGGIFGEGVDLPGEALSSVVIVGVGLPQVNRQSEQLREYFQQSYHRGFEFAYLYPGLQKVNQAMGRVIRGADDRGCALLIDGRYAQREYRQLLAPWWHYVE